MFEMFKLNSGGRCYIGAVATVEAARARIMELSEFWPAEYAVLDRATGQWTFILALREDHRRNVQTTPPPGPVPC